MAWMQQSLYGDLPACCRHWSREEGVDGDLEAGGDFYFPRTYVGFAGHFPGKPILPAVVQLAAVRYLCECVLGMVLEPVGYEKVKFKGMVQPEQEVTVSVRLTLSEGLWRTSFRLEQGNQGGGTTGLALFRQVERNI